jgi:methionyl-tRNA formyltransferase
MPIILVGSGEEFISYALMLKSNKQKFVMLYTSTEQFISALRNKESKSEFFSGNKLVSTEKDLSKELSRVKNIDYVLCFGIRWILSPKTLMLARRWYNLNIIPIPKFLGGAHISWQILCNSFTSSIIVQELTEKVDRGKVVFEEKFEYPKSCNLPKDFFDINLERFNETRHKICEILKFKTHREIEIDWNSSIYLPRLYTPISSWIDWGMNGKEIELWIRAFGNPYEGARTLFKGRTIYFQNAKFSSDANSHSFMSGLIVRVDRKSGKVIVGARDGFLELVVPIDEILKLSVGARFHTPFNRLENARKLRIESNFFGSITHRGFRRTLLTKILTNTHLTKVFLRIAKIRRL